VKDVNPVLIVIKDIKNDKEVLKRGFEKAIEEGRPAVIAKIIEKSEHLGVYNPEAEEYFVQKAWQEIEKAIEESGKIGINAYGVVKIGLLEEKIDEIAKEVKAKLIVIGQKKLSGFKKLVFGHGSKEVGVENSCPVLLIGKK
jgi:nucleotide-binding universal stress UspA family protein